ncbi:CheR family methyltransferase [Paraliomyxa miuraensis]|uniref:CheR family methyltransferase n=1 Tax=Paraliomyxa miuraensis TaxID=376150 RepID=UPI0022584306|nr:CheR family methyltransferase [Paraliomyxa miuraensis]MCX4247084.1 protein-glutamate O-methyltransferase CheR [Paraliomyxa miuraensis]
MIEMVDQELEPLELELFLNGVFRRYGYDFRNYARRSLSRRVRRAVVREDLTSISALLARVLRDPACMARLVEDLAVHVTAMFRDPEFHRGVRERVIPMLRTRPFIRVWHAGCSTGEEVYSLAIVLHEEGLYERSRLYATDICEGALERASRGMFPLHTMRENTRNYLRAGGRCDFSSYYTAGEQQTVFRRFLRENMVFSQHNLVSDPPFNEFDLILCRNVLIYFDAGLRSRVHRLLYDSLTETGILGLGTGEALEAELEGRYSQLATEHRLFVKVPSS